MAEKPKTGGNLLTRKVGPLPGWAWVAVAAGGGYLWLKHKGTTSPAASSDNTAGDATGTDAGMTDTGDNAADFAQPYGGAGLYTTLQGVEATAQTDAAELAKKRRELRKERRSTAAGKVNVRTHVYTATAATTLRDIAARFGVSVAKLKKDNPHLKSSTVAKGERIHLTEPAKKPVKKPIGRK